MTDNLDMQPALARSALLRAGQAGQKPACRYQATGRQPQKTTLYRITPARLWHLEFIHIVWLLAKQDYLSGKMRVNLSTVLPEQALFCIRDTNICKQKQ